MWWLLCSKLKHFFFSPTHRKGLRVVPESEVGLATIYASCDQYCNPSNQFSDTGDYPRFLNSLFSFFLQVLFSHCVSLFLCLHAAAKVSSRIPSASLSQSVAVDETVLPAASQNITAYVVNTEPSQRYRPAGTLQCLHCESYAPVAFRVWFGAVNCAFFPSGLNNAKSQVWLRFVKHQKRTWTQAHARLRRSS